MGSQCSSTDRVTTYLKNLLKLVNLKRVVSFTLNDGTIVILLMAVSGLEMLDNMKNGHPVVKVFFPTIYLLTQTLSSLLMRSPGINSLRYSRILIQYHYQIPAFHGHYCQHAYRVYVVCM